MLDIEYLEGSKLNRIVNHIKSDKAEIIRLSKKLENKEKEIKADRVCYSTIGVVTGFTLGVVLFCVFLIIKR